MSHHLVPLLPLPPSRHFTIHFCIFIIFYRAKQNDERRRHIRFQYQSVIHAAVLTLALSCACGARHACVALNKTCMRYVRSLFLVLAALIIWHFAPVFVRGDARKNFQQRHAGWRFY